MLRASIFALAGGVAALVNEDVDIAASCSTATCYEDKHKAAAGLEEDEADAMRTSLLQQRSLSVEDPEGELDEPSLDDLSDGDGNDLAELLGSPGNSADDDEIAKDFYERRAGKPVWHKLKGGHQIPLNEGEVIPGGTRYNQNDKQCAAACDGDDNCKSFIMCGRTCYMKATEYSESMGTKHNGYCDAYLYSVIGYTPRNKELLQPSGAPLISFYVYRAQAPATPDQDYPLANVNVASLGGVMWYLHNEVTKDCRYDNKVGHRRFSITRIRRFKITMKATAPLLRKKMHFSSLCSFDSGECTGPHRSTQWAGVNSGGAHSGEWDEYGYTVGCARLGEWPHLEFKSGLRYPDAFWYSLPGSCPTNNYKKSTAYCDAVQPGGLCDSPTGQGNCTFSYEEAGEIDLDELVGITPKYRDRAAFCSAGCHESTPQDPFCFGEDDGYDPEGKCGPKHFWDNIYDPMRNAERVQKAAAAFKKKYPDSDELPAPQCDFNRQRYNR